MNVGIETKRNVVGAWLLLMCVWPFIHFYVVRKFDVDPQRLWGLAMYITPHKVSFQITKKVNGRVSQVQLEELSQPTLDAFGAFFHKRKAIGKLVEPDSVGFLMLDDLPSAEEVVITIRLIQLEGESGFLRQVETDYPFRR